MNAPLWQPSAQVMAASNMGAFMRAAERKYAIELSDYAALHAWSVREPEQFGRLLWEFCGIVAERQGDVAVEHRDRMPGARWFPQARLERRECRPRLPRVRMGVHWARSARRRDRFQPQWSPANTPAQPPSVIPDPRR